MLSLIISALSLTVLCLFITQTAYASEITAEPETVVVGPNDWIRIFVKIDGYSGGKVDWNVIKPDGTTESGYFTNIQASQVTHTIVRNAHDNQFGEWEISYHYNDAIQTTHVIVNPLLLSATTDKQHYLPGDDAIIQISTNYFNPNAAKAETLTIEFVDDEGKLTTLDDQINIKVYTSKLTQEFSIDDFLNYNTFGK